MSTLERAISIATSAHQGQKDKRGESYILHPLAVMHKMTTTDEKIVAILHDVVEDTHITLDDLREEGYSDVIIEAVDAITKVRGEKYTDYLQRVKSSHLATQVKIQDITHNLSPERVLAETEKDLKRIKKYMKALDFLRDIEK